jgi:hypothetical protein
MTHRLLLKHLYHYTTSHRVLCGHIFSTSDLAIDHRYAVRYWAIHKVGDRMVRILKVKLR